MSLSKRIWLASSVLLALLFVGCVMVTGLTGRSYMAEQLRIHNAEAASLFALTLAASARDEEQLEATIATQFGTGFYEMVRFAGADGAADILFEDRRAASGAAALLGRLFPIEAEPGVAPVIAGQRQLGTLTLRHHTRHAYDGLQGIFQNLALLFLGVLLLAGLLYNRLLASSLRPLADFADQVKSFAAGRFETGPEPTVPELQPLARSLNALPDKFREMLRQESRRADKLQRESRVDKITGLPNREPFLQGVAAALENRGDQATTSLSLIRLRGLAQLNQVYGRNAIDAMLKEAGAELNRLVRQHSGWSASRLNGSDFALLAPGDVDAEETAKRAQAILREALQSHGLPGDVALPGAFTRILRGDTVSELLNRLDGALLAVDREGESAISISHKGDIQMKPIREQLDQWRRIILQAQREHRFSLVRTPVVGRDGELLHYECSASLAWEDEELAAEVFMPWVKRLELSGEIDQQLIDLALQQIAQTNEPLCVSLSTASLVESGFLSWINERLSTRSASAARLSIELPENTALRHLANFERLCARAKEHDCSVGIEHLGHQLAGLGKLQEVDLDYVKVDAAFIRDIDSNAANQALLRTLCEMGHAAGLQVIADGVGSEAEWNTLRELGADGATGPAISLPGS